METKEIILGVIAVVLGVLLLGALMPSTLDQVHKAGTNATWDNATLTPAGALGTVNSIWDNGIVIMVAVSGFSVFVFVIVRMVT